MALPVFAAGEKPPATKLNAIMSELQILLPAGRLGSASLTADSASFTTEADVSGFTTTVTVGTSRRIRITTAGQCVSSVLGDLIVLRIKESTTQLQEDPQTIGNAGIGQTFGNSVILSPSSGSHTYKVTAQRVAGTGTCVVEAGTDHPAILLVEDIGPV